MRHHQHLATTRCGGPEPPETYMSGRVSQSVLAEPDLARDSLVGVTPMLSGRVEKWSRPVDLHLLAPVRHCR